MSTPVATPVAVAPASDRPYVDWSPVVAGAVAAAAISFVLLTFGAAVGLSLTSPWPNSGASLWVVALAVAWWAVLVQIGSFAAGGYLAGRMRRPFADATLDERQFRDSAHGFLVWALGIVLGGLLLAMTTGAAVQGTAQSGVLGNDRADASRPVDYATDLLLRPGTLPAQGAPTQDGQGQADAPTGAQTGASAGASAQSERDLAVIRSEAERIFGATIRNEQFAARDRDYLTSILQQRFGLDQAAAQSRVDAAINEARDLEIARREQVETARRASVIAGFIIAATLLLGCVASCYAAALGGRHRDEGRSPDFYGYRFW